MDKGPPCGVVNSTLSDGRRDSDGPNQKGRPVGESVHRGKPCRHIHLRTTLTSPAASQRQGQNFRARGRRDNSVIIRLTGALLDRRHLPRISGFSATSGFVAGHNNSDFGSLTLVSAANPTGLRGSERYCFPDGFQTRLHSYRKTPARGTLSPSGTQQFSADPLQAPDNPG